MKRFAFYILLMLSVSISIDAQDNGKGQKALNVASKQIKEQGRKMSQIIMSEVPKAVTKVKNGDMDEFKILTDNEYRQLKNTIISVVDSIFPVSVPKVEKSTIQKDIDKLKEFFKWLGE